MGRAPNAEPLAVFISVGATMPRERGGWAGEGVSLGPSSLPHVHKGCCCQCLARCSGGKQGGDSRLCLGTAGLTAATSPCRRRRRHRCCLRCLKSPRATRAALRPAAPITPPPARQKQGAVAPAAGAAPGGLLCLTARAESSRAHTLCSPCPHPCALPSSCSPSGCPQLPALLTRVCSAPTQVQAWNWGPVARVGWCWPGKVQLVQRHPSMEDVLQTVPGLCERAVPGRLLCSVLSLHGTHPTGQPEDPL